MPRDTLRVPCRGIGVAGPLSERSSPVREVRCRCVRIERPSDAKLGAGERPVVPVLVASDAEPYRGCIRVQNRRRLTVGERSRHRQVGHSARQRLDWTAKVEPSLLVGVRASMWPHVPGEPSIDGHDDRTRCSHPSVPLQGKMPDARAEWRMDRKPPIPRCNAPSRSYGLSVAEDGRAVRQRRAFAEEDRDGRAARNSLEQATPYAVPRRVPGKARSPSHVGGSGSSGPCVTRSVQGGSIHSPTVSCVRAGPLPSRGERTGGSECHQANPVARQTRALARRCRRAKGRARFTFFGCAGADL